MFTVKIQYKDNSEVKFSTDNISYAHNWMVRHPKVKVMQVFNQYGFTVAMWERITGKRMRSFFGKQDKMFKNGIRQIEHYRTDCKPEDTIMTVTGIACSNCSARVDVFSDEYVRGYYIAQIDKTFNFNQNNRIAPNADYKKGYKNGYADD